MSPRLLTARDLPQAMELKEAAGWNQTETDWRNVLQLAPDGCFAIDCGQRLVATATVVCYGSKLAWIGMVLTHPEHRGRGFARRLMEHALEYLQARDIEWIKLDATDMGRPLYRALGFKDECAIERWGRAPHPPSGSRDLPPCSPESWLELDSLAFGADRSALLQTLAGLGSAAIAGGGYAMGRPGAKAAYFGPSVIQSPGAARELLAWFLARYPHQSVYWDLLPDTGIVRLAQEFGFQPLRRLVRMARPNRPTAAPFVHDDSKIVAIAGFEYG